MVGIMCRHYLLCRQIYGLLCRQIHASAFYGRDYVSTNLTIYCIGLFHVYNSHWTLLTVNERIDTCFCVA